MEVGEILGKGWLDVGIFLTLYIGCFLYILKLILLRNDFYKNILTDEEVQQIWTPLIRNICVEVCWEFVATFQGSLVHRTDPGEVDPDPELDSTVKKKTEPHIRAPRKTESGSDSKKDLILIQPMKRILLNFTFVSK